MGNKKKEMTLFLIFLSIVKTQFYTTFSWRTWDSTNLNFTLPCSAQMQILSVTIEQYYNIKDYIPYVVPVIKMSVFITIVWGAPILGES